MFKISTLLAFLTFYLLFSSYGVRCDSSSGIIDTWPDTLGNDYNEEEFCLYEKEYHFVDNATCLDDPDCHRNVTVCYIKDCCAFKQCDQYGQCVVAMPMCIEPEPETEVELNEEGCILEEEEYHFVDNETCLYDEDCYRNVTVCYIEGCCAFKQCDQDGQCLVAMPDCLVPEEEYHFVDNETCLNDENCHRNVTVCYIEGCCAFKQCDENGQCLVAMPDCVVPEEEYHFVDNETCLNDENCHRNVTVCYIENCCAFKGCDDYGQCLVAMPDCVVPEEEYHFVDNETCLNDENCHRNVTVCYIEGCCAFKECDENGQCLVAMPDCVVPEEEYHFVDNETCLNDENCHRNVTVCYIENCCAFKGCDDYGQCLVAMPDCVVPEEEYHFVDNETCLNDNDCHRNVTVCYIENCCSFKQCDQDGQCFVAMPMCIAPEEPKPQDLELQPEEGKPESGDGAEQSPEPIEEGSTDAGNQQ